MVMTCFFAGQSLKLNDTLKMSSGTYLLVVVGPFVCIVFVSAASYMPLAFSIGTGLFDSVFAAFILMMAPPFGFFLVVWITRSLDPFLQASPAADFTSQLLWVRLHKAMPPQLEVIVGKLPVELLVPTRMLTCPYYDTPQEACCFPN